MTRTRWVLLAGLLWLGCPGTLQDPQLFLEAEAALDAGGEGGSDGGGSLPDGGDGLPDGGGDLPDGGIPDAGDAGPPVLANCDAPTQIFQPFCARCHGPAPLNLGALDLISPGVASRLIGVTAPLCGTQTLVVAGQPEESYLWEKVAFAKPPCGNQMPQGSALSQANQDCVAGWIANLDGG
jgi:hypothetical protein